MSTTTTTTIVEFPSGETWKGITIWDRGHNIKGTATGKTHRCQLTGCRADRVSGVWDDGKRSRPCARGMRQLTDGSWEIR